MESIPEKIIGFGLLGTLVWYLVRQVNTRANVRLIAREKDFAKAAKVFREVLIPTKKSLNSDIGLIKPNTIIIEDFDKHHLAKETFIDHLKSRNSLNFKKDWQTYSEHYQRAQNHLSSIFNCEETQDSTSCEFRNSVLNCINKLLKYAEPKK